MKNFLLWNSYCSKNPQFKQIFRIMRFSLFFMFLFIFSAVAENSQSQNLSVSINKDNASLKTILDEIESQTDYLFIYKSDIDIMAIKSIHAEKTPVSDVLNKLFAKSNISYEYVKINHITNAIMLKVRKRDIL